MSSTLSKSVKLGVFTLAIMNVTAVVSLRGLPAEAEYGISSAFYYLFAAIVFLIPTSFVAAELAAMFQDKQGGVFRWVGEAFGKRIGFTNEEQGDRQQHSRDIIQKALNKRFAPEFINRIDEIINFDQLDINAIKSIVDLELTQIVHRLNEMEYNIELTDAAKEFLANKGYDVQFGARPLKRALQNYVEDGISELLLNEQLNKGDKILVDYDNNEKLKFTINS